MANRRAVARNRDAVLNVLRVFLALCRGQRRKRLRDLPQRIAEGKLRALRERVFLVQTAERDKAGNEP